MDLYGAIGKRLIDLSLSVLGLLLLGPLIMLLALIIRWRMGTPVLFRQRRPGLNQQPFTLLKFRTMTDARDETGALLPDEERLTSLGRLLRRSSLDELPQLINVLRGEMSLIGPRPLLMGYLPLYTAEQARRHEVRPGISGWAQVNGRNAISWEAKFAHDVWYVDHLSLGLDLRIAGMTISRVLRREGISQEGQATMEAFRGTNLPSRDH